MQKSNIFYICGDNSYLVEYDKNFLIKNFLKKFGEHSVEILPLDDEKSYSLYANKLISIGMFEEKRMFVFFGGRPKKTERKNSKKKDENLGFEANLENILPQISSEDIIIFHSLSAGEENLKKWLEKHATKREYMISFSPSGWKKFFEIDENILTKTLHTYQEAEKNREKGDINPFLWHSIADTLIKLSLLKNANFPVNESIIEEISHLYEWQKIFDFVDAIMAKNIKKCLQMSKKISKNIEQKDAEIFFAGLIGILRKNLYILTLRDAGHKESEILKILVGMNPYMTKKCLQSKISAKDFWKFFKKIIDANIASKSGKITGKNILWRFLAIDTALFELKK